ncbi:MULTISPECIES: dienelactone hydrolase family protein [unclassified Brenneria]|uniref:dienelactone hydrolase family protein n=1 Tax=unclassified Brenneria TaxID=2634434 RepID=UPI0018F0DEB9|nr:alpha/beta fold hydrolase [Brenneria sp. L3-3C-1]MBJ7222898.1 alpha/beta fold hydrolase [Brenneria sp. L3-3C-1]MEE3644137.1 alpha/beta fold hydrolase [Brenneria sp. L3_3C_1]
MKMTILRFPVWLLAALLSSTSLMANDMNTHTPAVTDEGLPSFYPQLKQQMTYPDSWLSGNYADFTLWKSAARQTLHRLLLTPEASKDFAPKTLAQQDRGDYVAEKVAFNLTDESRVNGLLLTPKTPGPHPAVVLLHDHGSKFDIGKEKMIKPWGNDEQSASAQAWADKFFSGRFVGDELAKRGYVVLAVDALGWGERGPINYEQQQALASNFFNLGRSLAGLMAYEDMRATDFLASLQQVDARRIGAVGFSMGAYRAWQLAALSDRIAATAAVSWIGTYEGLMTPGNNVLRGQSAFYMLHPGLPARMDFPDVASLAAPKPMLLFNGGKDALFPGRSVTDAYAKMHRVWQSQRAGSQLETRIWPELGHVFYQQQQEAVFLWLDRWLIPDGHQKIK